MGIAYDLARDYFKLVPTHSLRHIRDLTERDLDDRRDGDIDRARLRQEFAWVNAELASRVGC